MSDLSERTEDFALEPVPPERTVSGFRLAMVIIGFTITLPVFIAGSKIGTALGLAAGLRAFLGGGAILGSIGAMTAYIGAQAKVSTYVITQFSFGRKGAHVVNAVIAIALLGWYGITVELFGRACQTAVNDTLSVNIPTLLLSGVGSALMIGTSMWGFRALNYLSTFAVPLMMGLLGTAVIASLRLTSWKALHEVRGESMDGGTAVSLVVGSFIVGAILLPDLCRYARRTWEAMAAAAISLGVVFPIVFYCSMVPSLATGRSDLVLIMIGLGIGVPALVLLVFATWSTNSHNLYSTSLTLASLFSGTQKWKLTVIAGGAGTLMAAAGIMDNFVGFLLVLGTSIPPVAGIYAADFFFLSKQNYSPSELAGRPAISAVAFIAWVGASLLGYASQRNLIGITGIASCDSVIGAFVIYLLAAQLAGRFGLRPSKVGGEN